MIDTIRKGIIGMAAPAAGYAVSLNDIELWLKIVSLLVGIAVSLAMFVSISFTIRKKYLEWRKSIREIVRHHAKNSDLTEETTTI